jgi:hypothetical protein
MAKCPHCGKEVDYSVALKKPKAAPAKAKAKKAAPAKTAAAKPKAAAVEKPKPLLNKPL